MNLSQNNNSLSIISYSQCLKKDWVLESDKIDLWFFPFKEECIDLQTLSSDEIIRMNRFKFRRHRQRFLYYRSILRKILSLYTELVPKAVNFGYGQYGKPYLLNSSISLEFNLSHSEEGGMIGITKTYPIGVDIEKTKQLEGTDEIVAQHFSKLEYQAFKSTPDIQKRDFFYRLWTCKEAFIKALGDGLSYPLNQFSIEFSGEQFSKISEISGLREKGRDWSLRSYLVGFPEVNYMASYAIKSRTMNIKQYLMVE